MKNFIKIRSIQLLIFIALLMNFACGDDTSTTPVVEWGDNASNFDVTWDDDVIVFNKEDNNNLLSIDSSNYIFSYNKTSTKASSLKQNDIFVIDDFAVCRVINKVNYSDKYIIYSEPVPLTKAVVNADISWDYGVEFTEEAILNNLNMQGATIVVLAEKKYKFEFVYKSVKVIGEIEFVGEETPIKITFEQSVGGVPVAKLIVDGKFKRFRSTGNCQIRNKKVTAFSTNANDLSGEFTISATAAGASKMTGIEIPFQLVTGPLGVPFFNWKISFLGIFNSYVPPGGSCLISEKFKYSANQGFTYVPSSETVVPKANIKSSNIETGKYKDQHTGAPSVMQVAWGIAVPRFEISLMGTTLAWFHTAFLLDGYYNPNPACQMINAHFYGAAGWGLGMLGITVASGQTNFWDTKKVILKAGNCPK